MIRRVLLAVGALVLLSAEPAAAQVDYPPTSVISTSIVKSTTIPPETVPPETGGRVSAAAENGPNGLARTGTNNIVPLVQAAVVLIGGGALLALVARRRRAARLSAIA
ncbi:MAG: hypothetical protein ABIS47_09275 [Acidimicrobiales bacterium]